MIVIFLLLILLGMLQLWLWHQQQRRTQTLRQTASKTEINALAQRLRRHSLGKRVSIIFNDIHFHLVGKQRSVLLQHIFILCVAQGGGVYVSQEYLHLSLLITMPVVLVMTLYALYIRSRKKMRQEFETAFSEALNIVNSSIRAGNSVVQGIEQCGQKMEGMVGEEFRQVSQRLEIGEDPESVFMDSYDRMPYREYYFFIITVLINMKGGGQVKEVMSRLGTLISNGRIIERKKYAMTSEVRMSIKMLTAIPIFFFFFIKFQSPASFDILLYHPAGQYILYYSIFSILLGLFISWMMMNKI